MPLFVITGTRTGIGLGYVRHLASETSNIVVALVRDVKADISALRTIEASSEGRVHVLECDISSESSVSALPSAIATALAGEAKINFLINNAAVLHSRQETSINLSTAALQSHIDANVMGPARVVQALRPLLAPNAVIANITSGAGSLAMLSQGRIKPDNTAYGISKAALNMLTVHQAQHLKGQAIVVCVDPGHVKTEMGGPNAVVEIEDSVKGVLATLRRLEQHDQGKFMLYNGTELPW